TYSRPLVRPRVCSRVIGAPSKFPPTLPSFARNSSMVCVFQSLTANLLLLAEPRQVMGDLPAPPGPVVRYVVPPEVEVMGDALRLEYGGGRASRRQRAGGVGLPVPLTDREHDEDPVAQPLQVVALEVGQVVGRVV